MSCFRNAARRDASALKNVKLFFARALNQRIKLNKNLRGNPMGTKWRSTVARILVAAFFLFPIPIIAADFELYWDPNCNEDPDLEGYYIYYKYYEPGIGIYGQSDAAESSHVVDVYIPLSESGFDPDNPSCRIAGLLDDVRYCFTITAWYGNEESGMSNEICGANGTYDSEPDYYPDAYAPQYLIPIGGSTPVYMDNEVTIVEDGVVTDHYNGDSDTLWYTK
jgi:hypothetical protein